MESAFEFIAELSKRLNRPIKDLDDIRFAMAALKEIRENEIKIDMAITPIEVSLLSLQNYLERHVLWKLEYNKEYVFLGILCNAEQA